MRKILSVALLAFVFVSCKKDDDDNTTSGTILEKTIAVENGDSTIGTYTYDANNKMTSFTFASKRTSGSIDTIKGTITRDASGRITQLVHIEVGYPPSTTNVTYYGTTSQMRTKVINHSANSTDSSYYVYNGGNIMEYDFYKGSGGSFTAQNRVEWIIQNGNVVAIKNYNLTTGNVDGTTTITWDTKKPAYQQTVEESLITGLIEFGLTNNLLSSSEVWPATPANNESLNLSYTYTSNDQPATATEVWNPGGTASIKYFYR
jgi:hypothetical protein